MGKIRGKIIALVVLAIFTATQFLYLPSLLNYGHKVAFVGIVLFSAALCVVVFFSAWIKPEEAGLRVEQFGVHHLSFQELIGAAVVPFFPQTFLLVRTKERFPLNILFCPLQLDIEIGRKGRKNNARRLPDQPWFEG